VHRNRIDAGCATKEGTGLLATNSFARVQDNVILGANCTGSIPMALDSYAVRVIASAGTNELDLHSNTLLAGGGTTCTGRGLAFDVSQSPPTGALGVVRNNILVAGTCTTRYAVEEQSAAADPRLFENNDLWSSGTPTALYRDDAMTNLTMLSQVNALMSRPTATANISADPLFTAGNHLPVGSPCVNTGTATGAPTTDIDGDMRPQLQAFDIGADEYRP